MRLRSVPMRRPMRRLADAACMALAAGVMMGQSRARDVPVPPAEIIRRVGIDQKLDAQVPLELEFRDEAGRPVTLRECMGGKPAVLMLVYYECPSLCTVSLNNLTGALKAVTMNAGEEFNIVTVSFDPEETPELAAKKKAAYIERYGREGAESGWRFLTGEAEAIAALTESVGFRYVYDPATAEYAHGSVVIVLTPRGRVSRYLFGIEQSPRDLRLALVEASEERIGSVLDRALLLCYQYDPTTGKYGLVIMATLRAAGVATLLAMGTYIGRKVWQERRAGNGASVASGADCDAGPGSGTTGPGGRV